VLVLGAQRAVLHVLKENRLDSQTIVYVLVIAFFIESIVLHEIAHGYVAYMFGDPTAAKAGRLSFNPIVHIDLFMTIIVPGFLYYISNGTFMLGGAKPVPVNIYHLRPQNLGYACVSLAGVTVNFLIAVVLILALNFIPDDKIAYTVLLAVAQFNIMLMLFNLIPIPPLDGSRMVDFILPEKYQVIWDRIGRSYVGFFILIILLNVNWFLYYFSLIYYTVFKFLTDILLFL
jgi:Zn-dependent protease